MSIANWPINERPREKLLVQGPAALSDAELIAIFLRTGVRGKTAIDVARDLLQEYGSLAKLLESDLFRFSKQHGLGIAKYALLQASLELGRRYLYANLQNRDAIQSTEDTCLYIAAKLRGQQREVFACLYLDNRHRVISFDELFKGSIDSAPVYPREVVKRALEHNAAAVILAHNHPSGVAEPSEADLELTRQLTKALSTVQVRVLDHIIVGEGSTVSLAERGLV